MESLGSPGLSWAPGTAGGSDGRAAGVRLPRPGEAPAAGEAQPQDSQARHLQGDVSPWNQTRSSAPPACSQAPQREGERKLLLPPLFSKGASNQDVDH